MLINHKAHDNSALIKRMMNLLRDTQELENYYDFLEGNKHSLIDNLCKGEDILPPPNFFNELLEKNLNNKVTPYLQLAKEESNNFYSKVFLNGINNADDFKDFSKEFTKELKPIGQKLINLMILLRLYRYHRELKNSNSYVTRLFNKVRIFAKQKLILNQNLESIIFTYVSVLAATILTCASFFIAGGSKSIIPASVAATSVGMVGLILCLITHKPHNFEHLDVGGTNLVALKYRALFYARNLKTLREKVNS